MCKPPPPRQFLRKALVLAAIFIPLTHQTFAQTIINWDGGASGQDYLSGTAPNSVNFNGSSGGTNVNYGGGAATDRQALRSFSTSTVLSPTTNYPNAVNTSQYSSAFYGSFESIVLDSASGTAFSGNPRVRDGTSGSGPIGSVLAANTGASIASGTNYVATLVLGFKKSDFLNGGNSGSITLSSLSATFADEPAIAGTASNFRGRWLIGNGSSFYVSQTTFSLDAGTATLSDFTTSLWAAYTPATTGGMILNFQPSSFSTVNFNDVQFLGLYAESWDGTDQIIAGSGAMNGAFNLTDFSAVAVPEPRSVLFLVCGVLFLVVPQRRRISQKC